MTGRREQRNGWTESKKKRARAVGERGGGREGREACFEWQKIKTKDFLWRRGRESGYSVGGVFATRADWPTEYRVGLDTLKAGLPRFMQILAQGKHASMYLASCCVYQNP